MTFQFLKPDDVVDVIFPGTAATIDEVKKIRNFLVKNGLKPRISLEKDLVLQKNVTHEFPSFSPAKRFAQLQEAIENSESKAIWCARGGYGCGELAPFFSALTKTKKEKIFIGFSDVSSLNKILIEKLGWSVIAAPMLTQIVLNKISNASGKAILDFIFGRKKTLRYEVTSLTKSASKLINAEITGGCISVLAGHFGTKNQLDWKNKILFLEDEGESGERLDRYFRQLVEIMVEKKAYPKAILLGNFLLANNHGIPQEENVRMAIKRFAARLDELKEISGKKISIALFEEKSGCLGHGKNMMPLALGVKSEIGAGVLMQNFF